MEKEKDAVDNKMIVLRMETNLAGRFNSDILSMKRWKSLIQL
jgi:hypothetical protein